MDAHSRERKMLISSTALGARMPQAAFYFISIIKKEKTDMEIKEFGAILSEKMGDALGEGYSVECNDIVKNNGLVYHGLTVRKEGENIAPTIYVDNYYEEYKKGMMMQRIVNSVLSTYRRSLPGKDANVDFFMDFSKVSEKLYYRMVNYKKNKEKLRNVPIKRVLDLALVPVCYFEDKTMGCGSITINNRHLELWEITSEELWENVAESAPLVAPVKMRNLSEFIGRLIGEEDIAYEMCGSYVLTNKHENYGAGVILYPGVLKDIADDHECDLYIIPSSIHECIVIAQMGFMMDTDSLRSMIREVNVEAVAEEEVLSDNLYMYDREEDRLFVVKD